MTDDPDFRPPMKETIAVLLMLTVSIVTLIMGAFYSTSLKAERQTTQMEKSK